MMHHLVDKFITLTTAAQSVPIIVFIRLGGTLREGGVAGHVEFKKEIGSRYSTLTMVDVMDLQFERERFNIAPYAGHPSPYGNEVIPRGIEEALSPLRWSAPTR